MRRTSPILQLLQLPKTSLETSSFHNSFEEILLKAKVLIPYSIHISGQRNNLDSQIKEFVQSFVPHTLAHAHQAPNTNIGVGDTELRVL
jgi:hypothetical protein